MDAVTIKGIIRKELPVLIESDQEIRKLILDISKNIINTKADKDITNDKFDKILAELQRDREKQAKKWDEQNERMDALIESQDKKWEEQNKRIDALIKSQDKKWEEQNKKWYQQNQRIDALIRSQDKKWEEQNQKWYQQNERIDALIKSQDEKWKEQNEKWEEQNNRIEALIKSQDEKWKELHLADEELRKLMVSTVGALGARWGRDSEASFRNALKGILEDNFDISVFNYNEYDENGEVFGYPEEVELDIIIRNGLLIICEIKSSISNSEMYTFYKKAKFYEKQHNKSADSYIVISPMVSDKANRVASKFGIKVYTNAYDVDIF